MNIIDYIRLRITDWRTRRMLRRVNGAALAKLAPKIKQAEPRIEVTDEDDGTRHIDTVPTDDNDSVDLHVIRMTARHRLTLAGSDAQTLEHALSAVEVERDLLNKELDYYYRTPTERTTVTTPPKDYAEDRPSMVANKEAIAQGKTYPPSSTQDKARDPVAP